MILTDLIREVSDSNNSKKLAVDSQGQLIVRNATWFDAFTDWYTDKKVVNYIIEHKEQLYNESKVDFVNGKSIALLQATIDKIAEGAGLKAHVPDITGHVFSNWMDSLPDEVKSQPINKLFLPGTHDSTAYTVDFSTPIEHQNTKSNKTLSVGSKILNYTPVAKNIVENWTLTQNKTITEQLDHGIRLFDIRIAYNEADGKFYSAHTFTTISLEETLNQFAEFLKAHPTEFIMISMKPDYPHRGTVNLHKEDLVKFLNGHELNKLLITREENHDLSLKKIQDLQKNAMLVYDGVLSKSENNTILERENLHEKWMDKHSVKDELKALDEFSNNLKNGTDKEAAKYSMNFASYTVTPDADTIFNNFSLKNVALELNDHLGDFLDSHSDFPTHDNLIGVTMDFPSDYAIETIIKVNSH